MEKYWYDANGQRIKKQNSDGEFTYYINKFYEIDNGTSTSYFFRDDERVAKQTSGDMEWYLSDHLGSIYLMIDENGLDIERTDYFPYGQVRSGGLEKYGFTGQENDADTGLMYYVLLQNKEASRGLNYMLDLEFYRKMRRKEIRNKTKITKKNKVERDRSKNIK